MGSGDQKVEGLYLIVGLLLLLLLNLPSLAVPYTPYTVTSERALSRSPITSKPITVYVPLGHIKLYKRLFVYGPPENLAICHSQHIMVKPINVHVSTIVKGGVEITRVSFRFEVRVDDQAQPGIYYAPVYLRELSGGMTEAIEIKVVVTEKEYVPTHLKVVRIIKEAIGIIALVFMGLVGLGVVGYLFIRFLKASEPVDLEEEEGKEEEEWEEESQ
jgi:hypothetical protein